MVQHFISPDVMFDALDDILADAANHSTEIDQAHYGRAFGDHPCLTHSDIEKKRWICNEWHSFLSFGPFPIQDPITVVRSRRSTQPDKDVLKSALAKMLPGLLSMVAEAVVAKLGRVPSRMFSEQAEEPMAESHPPTNATVSQPRLPAPVDPPLTGRLSLMPATSSLHCPSPFSLPILSSSTSRALFCLSIPLPHAHQPGLCLCRQHLPSCNFQKTLCFQVTQMPPPSRQEQHGMPRCQSLAPS